MACCAGAESAAAEPPRASMANGLKASIMLTLRRLAVKGNLRKTIVRPDSLPENSMCWRPSRSYSGWNPARELAKGVTGCHSNASIALDVHGLLWPSPPCDWAVGGDTRLAKS
ncbi:hypothetical protein BO1005MUT1_470033 [Hyphomicrobiales bacterium]|nr:hypothetical protein BO1005MUT1_470033 [Hyphomicrobiales bacterium]